MERKIPMGAREHPVGTLLCLEISKAALTSQPRCQADTAAQPELMLSCGSSSSACKHQQQHKEHRYWNGWKGELSKLERSWGFGTWDLLCRAASPSLLIEDAAGQTGRVSSTTVPGKNRLSCLETILNSNKWSNIRGRGGSLKMERGKSVFYQKESHSLSLTPGADDGKTPPAASLAKRRQKIML